MKKIFLIFSLLLAIALFFAGCNNKQSNNNSIIPTATPEDPQPFYDYKDETVYPEGDHNDAMGINDENTFSTFDSLAEFLKNADPNGTYSPIVSVAQADNFAIKPLILGNDESLIEGHASIQLFPAGKDGNEISRIEYYYTDVETNYLFTVYYLTDAQLSIAKESGVAGILGLDTSKLEKISGKIITTVKNTETGEGFAELMLNDKYLIKINGAYKDFKNYCNLIDADTLSKIDFQIASF